MAEEMNNVSHIEEVDPNLWRGDKSSEVNDYLSMHGWILLNTGVHTNASDSGPSSSVYYAVGWIGQGEPVFPPAGPAPH